MIKGIGIDLVRIGYIEKMLEKYDQSFLSRCFSLRELNHCEMKKLILSRQLAGKFAAKEAVFKAVHSYLSPRTDFLEIEILQNQNGRPSAEIGQLLKCPSLKWKVHLTISDHSDYSIAIAIVEFLEPFEQ
jgi:holo-[acyl-carrier protein] synthase